MRGGNLWAIRDRSGSAPVLMVLLLALAGLAGDSAFVGALRGRSAEAETQTGSTLGYYESIINAPRHITADETTGPPPGWLPFGGEVTGIVRELPTYLRWEMKPNLDIRWNGTTFQTNSLGFRTREVSLEKSGSVYRILVFGSSNTMGYGIEANDGYTRRFERWLNEQVGPARRVEVVNLAVAGDSPTRRLARMQKEAARFDADWILCDATAMDSWLEETHVHSVLERSIPITFPFVQEAVRRSNVSGRDSLETFREKFRGEVEGLFSHVYEGWSAEAKRLGVPLSVVLLPRGDSKSKSPRVFELIRSLCGQNGIDLLDLSNAFEHMSVEEFRISDWDKHPNATGHRAMFERLRDAVVARGELPGLALLPAAELADREPPR
jgi:lysophospholipase L1-like esterase